MPHSERPAISLLVATLVLSCVPRHSLIAQDSTLGDPLPLDVALSLRGHNYRSPVNLSPDGVWLAHTIEGVARVPRDSVSRVYTATGVPLAEGDARMEATITNPRTGEAIRLGAGTAASWAPVWSPDGARVAFYSDEGGVAGLWVWEKATRTTRRVSGIIVRPFFGFEQVQWLPDGRRLLVEILPEGSTVAEANAFGPGTRSSTASQPVAGPDEPSVVVQQFDPEADTAGADTSSGGRRVAGERRWAEVDLAVVDVVTGQVTRLARGVVINGYAPSPDGSLLAYTVWKGGEENTQQADYDLVVQDLASGAQRVLGTHLRMAYGIEWSWSPDGKQLAYVSSGQLGSGEIIVYTVSDGTTRRLGGEGVPSFDPGDGEYPPLWDASATHLYAVGDSALWRLDVATGQGTSIGRIPGWKILSAVWRHGTPTIWSTDRGRTVWVVARERGRAASAIYAVDVRRGKSRQVVREPKTYSGVFNLDANDRTDEIAFVSTGQRQLPEIWLLDTKRGEARQGSRINASLDRYELGRARIIEWHAADGRPLRGALLLPPRYRPGVRVPLVAWVYGGDMGSNAVTRFGLWGGGAPVFDMHVLATRGYAVLYPDAPLNVGTPMSDLLATVMPGVDAAIEQGYADPDRLAIMGQSYGSYCTLALITQTTRFKAAVITAAVLHPDLFADYLRGIGYYEHGQGNMGGSIWEFRDRYLENSPLFSFDRIETPLLIGQGQRDGDLVPSEAIYTALKRLGKPVEYRVYGGEGHVITQKANVLDFWKRRRAFLAEHLDVATDARGAVVFVGGRAKGR